MSNITPLAGDSVAVLAPILDDVEQSGGFVLNSMLTMATQLEQPAVDFSSAALGGVNWPLVGHGV